MGIRTTLVGENLTLTTAVNVLVAFRTQAAGSLAAHVFLRRLEINQAGSTTLGTVRGQIATRDTAGTLTCTSLAPKRVWPLGGSASGLSGNTAPAGADGRSGINGSVDSGGTYTEVRPFEFPNLNGYIWQPTEVGQGIWVPPSTVLVVRFKADPAALTGWTFVLDLEEE